jgi:hypothetical protein
MTDEQAREKMEEYAMTRLRKAVRNFIEIDQNVEWVKTWAYNIDGERYEVEIKIHRTKGKEGAEE